MLESPLTVYGNRELWSRTRASIRIAHQGVTTLYGSHCALPIIQRGDSRHVTGIM
jgi:hypothetical protein